MAMASVPETALSGVYKRTDCPAKIIDGRASLRRGERQRGRPPQRNRPRSCYVRVSFSNNRMTACAIPLSGASPSTFSGSISCQSMRSTASSAATAYHAGAEIQLRAFPAGPTPPWPPNEPVWVLASWEGTSHDDSTATTNSLTMPAGENGVVAHYAKASWPYRCADLLSLSRHEVDFGVRLVGPRDYPPVKLDVTNVSPYQVYVNAGILDSVGGAFATTGSADLFTGQSFQTPIWFFPASKGPATGILLLRIGVLVAPGGGGVWPVTFGSVCSVILRGVGECSFDDYTHVGSNANEIWADFQLPFTASACGYDHYNWNQIVLRDPYRLDLDPPQLTVPYLDPPLFPAHGKSFFSDAYLDPAPFYWNEERPRITSLDVPAHLDDHTFPGSLGFFDAPGRPSVPGAESAVTFRTRLAGVFPDGNWESLYLFEWSVDYSGIQPPAIKAAGQERTGRIFGIHILDKAEVSPEETELLRSCRNCALFSDGFESGDLSRWLLSSGFQP